MKSRKGIAAAIALGLGLGASLVTAARPAAAAPAPVAITHVTVIDMTGAAARADQTVLIDRGVIARADVAARVAIPKGARVIDGRGKYLIPGLWDMHIHLANRPDSLLAERFLVPLLLAHGVTGVRDMGGDPARIRAIRAAVARNPFHAPHIVAPGPFVDGPQDASPIWRSVTTAAEARAAVRSLKREGADFVKIQSGLSRECMLAVADESKRQGLRFAGHVPEALTAFEVIAAGPASLEHVSPSLPGDAGLMRACSANEPALRDSLRALNEASQQPKPDIAALRARQRDLQSRHLDPWDDAAMKRLFHDLNAHGTHVVPTLVWSQSLRALDSTDTGQVAPLEYVPRAMRERWRSGRRRYVEGVTHEALTLNRRMAERSIDLVGAMHRAGVAVMAGTDAFDAFVLAGPSLHQELELLVRAGFTPLAALQAATVVPARFLGRARTQGTIERGKQADLVLLSANPLDDIRNTRHIDAVVAGGSVLDRSALGALLASLAAEGMAP